ncbi:MULTISPECIES: hypothetical protein [unclassified Caballeronia]|uniref:hypothetical protein n=1 Tax=unclassified Caballeronia TaxID=2646786 RepID=UPI002863721C|nr:MULTISPECIES: hypothetical protein [unclassified Caballeronia]MDR5776926.1 hypothetical protein [Caballeronia sp. LZ002]MDR5798767.1 hypothetical protein [Caballeronia sp. LZ001]MDR5852289.1 hypothetical protein [Caballeronia sp. LZ003]
MTYGRERAYIQDFFNRHAFNFDAFPPEVVDVYATAYSAPGGMRAAFEVYRAFDQDSKDDKETFAKSGKLRNPMLFIAGQESGFLSTVAENIATEIAENGIVYNRCQQWTLRPGRESRRFCGGGVSLF